MRDILQCVLWAVGLFLEVMVIRALLRGTYRRYPLLFAYAICLFLTTVVEVSAATAAKWGARAMARSWRVYYWIDDAILQALLFSVVIALIWQAMEHAQTRAAIRRWLLAGAFLLFTVLFAVHKGPMRDLSAWMTLISRDLSFAAVVLDLLLWSSLVASRRRNHQLLLLSGGLGIQFTGAAIGQSFRQLAHGPTSYHLALAGSILVVTANLACLYVWWQAFRRPAPVAAESPTA